MRNRDDFVEAMLGKLKRVHDEKLTSLSETEAAQALFREVVSMERSQARSAVRRPRRRRRRLLLASGVAAVGLALAVFFGVSQLVDPRGAQAAVQFSQTDDYIVATIIDVYASSAELRDAFAAQGLDIDLKLVPVSPSLVGSVVFIEDESNAGGIETISSPDREAPGGPLQIGIRVPVGYKGHAEIDLGRPAKPEETYVSSGIAFAEGEALHGSGLVGMKVKEAVRRLTELGLSADWRSVTPEDATRVDPASISEFYVTDAFPKAPGKVIVFASPSPKS